MEGPEIKFAEAVLDNGTFGTRTVRFETGRLAQQAQGAVAAYLDEETMLLCATSAGKHPKDNFDFFPLTVDVEERSYAAGKIPGSFFRREGRPSTEAILVCRLIDRPLRPSFVDGLRNEVQIVITVLSIAPDEFYDALAINAASASTQISGLPFSGPIAGVRLALIPTVDEDQWVAFPKASQLEDAVFDLTVAGRVVTDADGTEDVAIMMVEAEATENAWNLIQAGAIKPERGRRRPGPRGRQAVPQASSSRRRRSSPRRPPRRSPTTRSSCPTRRRPTTPSPASPTTSSSASTRSPTRSSARTPTTPSRSASRPPIAEKVEAGELPAEVLTAGLGGVQVGHQDGRPRPHPHARASASTVAA